MITNESVQRLNFFLQLLEGRLKEPYFETADENLNDFSMITRNMENAALKVLGCPDLQKQVPEETYLKVHSLATKIIRMSPLNYCLKNEMKGLLKNIEDEISEINQILFIKALQNKDPHELTATNLRTIESFLLSWAKDRKDLQTLLVHEFFEFCKNFLMCMVEQKGGRVKKTRREGLVELDFQTIPFRTADDRVVSSRFEQAANCNRLVEGLKELLQERPDLDSKTNELLQLWEYWAITHSISEMQLYYLKDFLDILTKTDKKKDRNQYVMKAIEATKNSKNSFEYQELEEHVRDPSHKFPFSSVVPSMCAYFRKISLCSVCFQNSMGSFSQAYKQGYMLYQKGAEAQKGFVKKDLMSPDEFCHYAFPSFERPEKIIEFLQKPAWIWLELLNMTKDRGLCACLLLGACPESTGFINQVLEFLGLEPLADVPPQKPLPEIPSPAPAQVRKKHHKKGHTKAADTSEQVSVALRALHLSSAASSSESKVEEDELL